MDSLHLCWRGAGGSGKRQELHRHLQKIAAERGVPFVVSQRLFQVNPSTSGQGDDEEGSTSADKNSLPYEFSYIHLGFDIARMSMQDKILLRPILQKLGSGAQVLAGNQKSAHRILVFYHAHLLSTESCYLLHGLLEEASGMSLWMTSELPIPNRLADYFLEIPVAGGDRALQSLGNPCPPSWKDIFLKVFGKWKKQEAPKISETTEVRDLVYEILMRNLRWVECVHILLDVFLEMELPMEQRSLLLGILASQEATAAGQTIPSYRIPLLWEALFLRLREALSPPKLDGNKSSPDTGRITEGSRKSSSRARGVAKGSANNGRHDDAAKAGVGR